MTDKFEAEILNAIKPLLVPYLEQSKNHKFDVRPGFIEVICQQDDSDVTDATILQISVDHDQKQLQITRLNTPGIMKGLGLGKRLIKEIYISAKAHGYEVFVTNMTPGFYERLTRRGARSCNDEMVQINDATVLA
ncbi:GNAT family N-acetyltransferase [Pusillimonas sp. ANT_WB101]|uniref:GNAT family N-acetyltransferase n=1 Tax=Pusillimonas sp. ANT_WB101 TaxID=2597356 RepID=UPI0011EBE6F1|nr:GNAT family N-acetyltransferase [Pusillimonas sp. ANT_WB101]KAA0889269.1 hypothetical protein FQ179_19015 [Pusillimonas sp. ANT_WB101]